MPLESVKQIRVLERGLSVMRLLEDEGAVSLDDLNRATGIPKASLGRILVTLQSAGVAAQRLADNRWIPGPGVGASAPKSEASNMLVQAAVPELDKLCAKVIWPSDMSVRSGLHMVLADSSRSKSGFAIRRLAVGFKIDFLLSAPGRAYLAHCPDKERARILSQFEQRPEYGNLFAHGRLDTILQQVRESGYGYRDTQWGGREATYRKDADDGLDAIAVPILYKNAPLGCINITWIRSVLTRKQIVERHLADLIATSKTISIRYDAMKHG